MQQSSSPPRQSRPTTSVTTGRYNATFSSAPMHTVLTVISHARLLYHVQAVCKRSSGWINCDYYVHITQPDAKNTHLITGSIALSTTRRYLIYSQADFEVFRPTGVTRCNDGGEIWHRGGDLCMSWLFINTVQVLDSN